MCLRLLRGGLYVDTLRPGEDEEEGVSGDANPVETRWLFVVLGEAGGAEQDRLGEARDDQKGAGNGCDRDEAGPWLSISGVP